MSLCPFSSSYLFRKLFHPLVRRVLYHGNRVSNSSGIPMVKLDEDRIRWIIKCKEEGKKNADIARIQKISIRRVQQIYSWYQKNKMVPVLRKPGRPTRPVTEQEIRVVRDAHKRYRANALYLQRYIYKIHDKQENASK